MKTPGISFKNIDISRFDTRRVDNMTDLLERFLKYVSFDTQSDELSETQPSTEKQFDLLKVLQDELSAMGIESTLNRHGYLYAAIPANTTEEYPKIGSTRSSAAMMTKPWSKLTT